VRREPARARTELRRAALPRPLPREVVLHETGAGECGEPLRSRLRRRHELLEQRDRPVHGRLVIVPFEVAERTRVVVLGRAGAPRCARGSGGGGRRRGRRRLWAGPPAPRPGARAPQPGPPPAPRGRAGAGFGAPRATARAAPAGSRRAGGRGGSPSPPPTAQ